MSAPSGSGRFWKLAVATLNDCPACGERGTYNLDGDCCCTKCGFDGADAHEARKRRRWAEQEEH